MMSRVIEVKCLGAGTDGAAFLMQKGDFQWVRKTFNPWGRPDRVVVAPSDPYIAECEAYKQMSACPSLDGRVPRYYGHGRRALHIEYIDGILLDSKALPLFMVEQLQQMYETLKEVVQQLHAIDIVHGDISTYNIMVDRNVEPPKPFLIDFSRAVFPYTVKFTARMRQIRAYDWEFAKRRDLGSFEADFKDLVGRKHCSEAMRILEVRSHGLRYSPSELADHVEHSGSYNDKLRSALITLDVREPLYIVAMTKNLIKNCAWEAQEYVEKHLPMVVSHQAEDSASIDQRSMVMMQAYKAEMSGEDYRCMYLCRHYLPAAIKLCEDNLGYMDNFTVLMRLKLAQRNIKKECARPMLETLLQEVTNYVYEPDVPLETKHPHYVPLQKERLIGIINDSLAFAGGFTALKADNEADGVVSYEEECTSACSHHLDFPDRPHHASRPYLTEKERDADRSDTSEKWRWKIYETNRSM